MRQLIILFSIIDLAYLHNKFIVTKNWVLTYNPNNVLSEQIRYYFAEYSFLHYNIFYLFVVTTCFFSLFKNSMQITKLFGYSMAIFIISISTQIGLNILSFQEHTTFAIKNANYPISIELKLQYLASQIELLLQKNLANALIDSNNSIYYREALSDVIKDINLTQTLSTMTPKEISDYARELFNKII